MRICRFRTVLPASSIWALVFSFACSAPESAGQDAWDSVGPESSPNGAAAAEQEPVAELQQGLTSPYYGTVTYIGNIPSDKATDWFSHAQGVALGLRGGQVNMFYSTNSRLYGREAQSSSQFGVSQSMPAAHWEHGPSRVLTDLKMNHYGDLDFQHTSSSDILLVPCERDDRAFAVVASFVLGDPYMMSFHSYAVLSGNGGSAPWVAASKADPSQVFSSPFNGNFVARYRDSDAGPGFNLAAFNSANDTIFLVNSNYAKKTLNKIQGGEFNYGGRLFLIASEPAPGVYGFELVTAPSTSALAGKQVFRQFDFYPAELHPSRHEEFEGITVGLIDPPAANDRSQIHVVLNQDGNIFFKHWSVSQLTSHFTLR
jgi:hypothetical protein